MFYAIFNELFSSNSPQAIYGAAFDKCKDDTRVQDALGQPIKCFGEESRRRRRTHIAHQIYQKNNRNYMRLSFHIQGIRNKATVHCEMRMVRNCDRWRNVVFLTKFLISRMIQENTSSATSSFNWIHIRIQRSSLKTIDSTIQSTLSPSVKSQRQSSHEELKT